MTMEEHMNIQVGQDKNKRIKRLFRYLNKEYTAKELSKILNVSLPYIYKNKHKFK
jgi:hypothetical protein